MSEGLAPEAVTQEPEEQIAQEGALTPEAAFDATQDKSTLLDDFFRANKVEEPEAEAEPSPVDTQGEATSQEATAENVEVDNDEKRYQYWQSEADKARNENDKLKERLDTLEVQFNQVQPNEAIQEEQHSFPAPPGKPEKPRSYSRTEALDDPDSESARYMDAVDNWRDDMDEYNRLHQQYTQAVMQEERERIHQEQQDMLRAQAEKEQYNNNMAQMTQHLKQTYQASDDEIAQFVEKMDNPKNITVDNLFQLYRMQSGNPQTVPSAQTAPNESFNQRRKAQSVPSPMGVVSGQSSSQANNSDSVMDFMLSDYEKRNPFG